jgi:hypothetical protein
MLTISRPPLTNFSRGERGKLYTIHTEKNLIYATNPSEKISVMSFSKKSQAELLAGMIEEYKRHNFSWPPMDHDMFTITSDDLLHEIDIIDWEPDELDNFCAVNMLGLVTITSMTNTNQGYRFKGDLYQFTLTDENYRDLFELKLQL